MAKRPAPPIDRSGFGLKRQPPEPIRDIEGDTRPLPRRIDLSLRAAEEISAAKARPTTGNRSTPRFAIEAYTALVLIGIALLAVTAPLAWLALR